MNATWWSNSSGSWVQFASNWTSFANNTNITQPFTNASAYNTTYYWSVNVTDGISWTNETYHFTTESEDTSGGNGGNGGGTPGGGSGTGGGVSNAAPTADANGPYTGYVGQVLTFNGTGSSDPNSDTLTYTWNFGDGNNGTGASPIHTYNSSGLYNVTLTVSDGSLTHNDITTANISEPPVEPDSDGDGYSDEMEDSYGTNATDPNDYPLDTNGDGTPDEDSPDGKYTGDLDDDGDGVNDEVEEMLGSDPKNESDVKSIIDGGYLVDTNGSGQYDTFYNATSSVTTNVITDEDGN